MASVVAEAHRAHLGRALLVVLAPAAMKADQQLEQLGLSDAAGRVARGYSGGMQRRLDVAMGSSTSRRCCSSTSRRRAWTPRRARRCGRRSRA
jgi:ABC-type glutathione transport system ATPase component